MTQGRPECFVIMPVTDPDGYEPGHFERVFADIFCPACTMAGYAPVRADQVRETNLIHLDVLQRLLDSPIALCDLSSRNPNVLFELGLRQAFDKPVVLVQEVGTPRVFDIAPLRYTEYRRDRIYDEVLEDQNRIAQALVATTNAVARGTGINSIVRILSLTWPAALPEQEEARNNPLLNIVRAEIGELRDELRRSVREIVAISLTVEKGADTVRDLEALSERLQRLKWGLDMEEEGDLHSAGFAKELSSFRDILSSRRHLPMGGALYFRALESLLEELAALEQRYEKALSKGRESESRQVPPSA